jgi:2-polyprenyl-6-hydroxyphenyl methylase/3-demethylubiquinone-9 3-methyltransferase
MTENKLQIEYDAWHCQMYSGENLPDPLRLPWYNSAFADIKQNAHGKLLEIGCGRGEFAVWLAEKLPDIEITAVDFSSAAIGTAKQYAYGKGSKIQLIQDDAQDLGLPNNYFDYVVSCECIEHVPQPGKMAQELCRVLKPGGHFCITTENYLNGMLLAWAKSWIAGEPFNSGSGVQPHENFFFFWHIFGYLRSAGLVVNRTESCHYQWLLLPRVDPAKLCTKQFSAGWARLLAKPFGRHFSYFGQKTGST